MITNYLSPIEFVVSVARLPNVEFFTQKAVIPGISMNPTQQPTPFKTLYTTPDRLEYQELDLSFIIDENMDNYKEIFSWMEGMGKPDEFDQFRNLKESQYGLASDITLIIKNSSRNPNLIFVFKECFPINLGSVSLDVTATDVFHPECTVTFRHNGFTVNNIS